MGYGLRFCISNVLPDNAHPTGYINHIPEQQHSVSPSINYSNQYIKNEKDIEIQGHVEYSYFYVKNITIFEKQLEYTRNYYKIWGYCELNEYTLSMRDCSDPRHNTL